MSWFTVPAVTTFRPAAEPRPPLSVSVWGSASRQIDLYVQGGVGSDLGARLRPGQAVLLALALLLSVALVLLGRKA